MADASRLTVNDQEIVTQARQLLLLDSSDAIHEHTGDRTFAAFALAFYEAKEVIAGLLAVIAGLEDDVPRT
jgi:hypothetical protein